MNRPKFLAVATDGPCAGHPCDGCAICRSGTCCRRDHPDYRLPDEGDWDGPHYGDIGVFLQDGEQVQCHCCGEWKRMLVQHIRLKHNLTTAEYRAIFGLKVTQRLVADRTKEKLRDLLLGRIANGYVPPQGFHLTPEQLSQVHTGRVVRRQAKNNVRQAIRDHFGTQGSDATKVCTRCGESFQADHVSRRSVCSSPDCIREQRMQALDVAHERRDSDTYRWRDGIPPAVRLGPASKLSDDQWQEAMALRRDGRLTYLAISQRYGISKNNLRRGLVLRSGPQTAGAAQ